MTPLTAFIQEALSALLKPLGLIVVSEAPYREMEYTYDCWQNGMMLARR